MALSGVSQDAPSGDYIDFKALSAEGAAVVMTIRELLEPEQSTYGEIEPVRARVIVLTGEQKGQVFEDEKIISKGITSSLRRRDVGDDVVGRIRPYGQGRYPGLEREDSGDIELAEKALAHFDGAPAKASKAKASKADDDEPPF